MDINNFVGCRIFGTDLVSNISTMTDALETIGQLLDYGKSLDNIRWSKSFGASRMLIAGKRGRATLLVGFPDEWVTTHPKILNATGFGIIEMLHKELQTLLGRTAKQALETAKAF